MCEICPIDNWSTVRGGGQAGWRPCLRLQCGGRLLLPLAESTLTRTTKCIFPNSKMYLYFVQNSLPPSHKKGRSSYFCCFFHADITTTPNSIPHQNKFVQIAICVRPCYKQICSIVQNAFSEIASLGHHDHPVSLPRSLGVQAWCPKIRGHRTIGQLSQGHAVLCGRTKWDQQAGIMPSFV